MKKKEAQRLLGYKNIRSIELLMKAGKLTFDKLPQVGKWFGTARVEITGSPDPAIQAKLFPPPPAPPKPKPVHEDSTQELPMTPEQKFAADYLAGLIPDSCGNYYDGPLATSLIGPHVREDGPPVDHQCHMDPALLGTTIRTGHSFDQGLTQDKLDEMRAGWRRAGGGPSMSQQREQIERSRALINAAFPKGEPR